MPCVYIKIKSGEMVRAQVQGRVTEKQLAALKDVAEAAVQVVQVRPKSSVGPMRGADKGKAAGK